MSFHRVDSKAKPSDPFFFRPVRATALSDAFNSRVSAAVRLRARKPAFLFSRANRTVRTGGWMGLSSWPTSAPRLTFLRVCLQHTREIFHFSCQMQECASARGIHVHLPRAERARVRSRKSPLVRAQKFRRARYLRASASSTFISI